MSIHIEDYGTSKVSVENIENYLMKNWFFAPKDVSDQLRLREPRYFKTASYGHFGRDIPEMTWEKRTELKS